MTSIRLLAEREPALTVGIVAGVAGTVDALRRGASASAASTPLLAGIAAGALIRGMVTPWGKVRDPELLRPPWLETMRGGEAEEVPKTAAAVT
jgi:hypothetical protein